jgi:hypothetical protein
MLDEKAAKELAADIRSNGLRHAIVTYNGAILDGRNRYLACLAAGVEPRFKEYEGDNPLGYVTSLNLLRRHLNESQRALVAAKIADMGQGVRSRTLRQLAQFRSLPQRTCSVLGAGAFSAPARFSPRGPPNSLPASRRAKRLCLARPSAQVWNPGPSQSSASTIALRMP